MNFNYFTFPNINPQIFSFGPVSFYWYGIIYFLSFLITIYLAKIRRKYFNDIKNEELLKSMLYIIFIGIFLGSRIGYILFYNFSFFINDPFSLLRVWNGGMSFHGGLIGAIISIFLFSNKKKIKFFRITDFIVPIIPCSLGMGRIGNFINGELWGRVTFHIPWAMLFPRSYNDDLIFLSKYPQFFPLFEKYKSLPRHPSQLYEFLFEGIILFFILNYFIKNKKPIGNISSLFLIFYGIFRFFLEFFREPDIQVGLFFNFISIGQILSIPMIIFGIIIMVQSCNHKL